MQIQGTDWFWASSWLPRLFISMDHLSSAYVQVEFKSVVSTSKDLQFSVEVS
jgi:hypothetical protein